jgi:hypothetical protein
LLFDEGLVDGSNQASPEDFAIFRLTFKGYEYLPAIRDPGIWDEAKTAGNKVAGIGFGMLCGIAKGLLVHKLKETFGIDAS